MNEAEKRLREAWAKASAGTRENVADWKGYKEQALGSAVRAFCESEPSAPAVAEPEALRRVREAWARVPANRRERDLAKWRMGTVPNMSDIERPFCAALADLLEGAPVEGGGPVLARAKKNVEDSFVREVARHTETQIKLAAAEKERDKLRGDHRYACGVISRISNELGEAKREAEAMRNLATRNANELNAAHRSYSTQIADLTRALDAEKKAHNEALKSASRPERAVDRELREALTCTPNASDESAWCSREYKRLGRALDAWLAAPLSATDAQAVKLAEVWQRGEPLQFDEYTRAAVKFAEAWASPGEWSRHAALMDEWSKTYAARQRGEPSAPVAPQPPARVLECWASEFSNGAFDFGYGSRDHAFRNPNVVRAHKVALQVSETVERGQ